MRDGIESPASALVNYIPALAGISLYLRSLPGFVDHFVVFLASGSTSPINYERKIANGKELHLFTRKCWTSGRGYIFDTKTIFSLDLWLDERFSILGFFHLKSCKVFARFKAQILSNEKDIWYTRR